MNLLKQINEKRKADGFQGLLGAFPEFLRENVYRNYIRPLQPIKRYTVWNGVQMSPQRSAVRWFDTVLPQSLRADEYERSEGGEVEFHKTYTESGDHVTIIGGGRGVTTVHAAWESSPDGHVTAFEGSSDMVAIIEDTIRINGVEDFCTVRHALVGPDLNVYSDGPKGAESIHPRDLPKCDVIEMDCEGAEIDILNEMTIEPEVMIIEVHPRRHSLAPENYLETLANELTNKGYRIEERRDNEGEKLSTEEFESVCYAPLEDHPGAPVIAAVHESSNRR